MKIDKKERKNKTLKEKLHDLYLAGCDNRAFVGADLEKEILKELKKSKINIKHGLNCATPDRRKWCQKCKLLPVFPKDLINELVDRRLMEKEKKLKKKKDILEHIRDCIDSISLDGKGSHDVEWEYRSTYMTREEITKEVTEDIYSYIKKYVK